VEFIIMLPIFTLVLVGIIGFGIVLSQQIALTNAVRQGARAAVVAGSDVTVQSCGGIVTNVRSDLGAPGMAPALATVRVARIDSGTGAVRSGYPCTTGTAKVCAGSATGGSVDSVRVDATYPADLLGFGTVSLEARAVYQCEFSTP
jgi:Flp pilus assembly protein TadG